ncbi:MAG: hypothetical protein JWM68_703 [Verrucomicrobiales bacterium]|nr:hypothetical protein [Verrucomicrobiales bacterium]
MTIEAPPVVRRLFSRLSNRDNRILSRNGPDQDPDLFVQVEASESACSNFLKVLGYRLEKGDNCFYLVSEDETRDRVEAKLEQTIRLVRLLNFLSIHVEGFGEGQTFSAINLAARCNGDPQAERVLQQISKGATNGERLNGLLQHLVDRGFLSKYDESRDQYRVLSAINYLFDFVDRINIPEDGTQMETPDATT